MRTTRDVFNYSDLLKSVRELGQKRKSAKRAFDNFELTPEQQAEIDAFKSGKVQFRNLSKDTSMWLSLESLNEQQKNPILYSHLPNFLEQETWTPTDAMLILAGVDPEAVIMEWSYENFMGAKVDEPKIRHANWFTSISDLYDHPVREDFEYSSTEIKQLLRKAESGSTEDERKELDKRLSDVERWEKDDTSNFKSGMLNLRSKMLGILKRRWDSGEHDITQRRAPLFFVRWAESRDFEIEWAEWARKYSYIEEDAPVTSQPFFDADSEEYPELLHIAVRAWDHARTATGGTPKQRISTFIANRYPHISDGTRDAISLVANWQKAGGRPKTVG